MKTNKRLNSVYESAVEIPFDDNSKFIFFSDTHRGDDSISDEFGRNKHIFYHALNYYYQNDFTYVEVGDGDELWEHTNYEHIRNAHFMVFELLKEFFDKGRLLMLFGNHNDRLKSPEWVEKNMYQVYDEYLGEKVDLFPGLKVYESILFKHRKTHQKLFVVHGHQGDLLNDQLSSLSYVMIHFFWRFMHLAGVKYAASPAKSRRKRHKVEKNYTKWNQENDTILICGHTHRPKFPDPGESTYFNTGCCMHPRGITGIELMYGKLVLVTWRVHSKKDGTMYIKRTALKGPIPIKAYEKKGVTHDQL